MLDGFKTDQRTMIGRFFGWVLIALAILTASGEAVMALGTGSYDGIAAGEVWTLLSGQTVDDTVLRPGLQGVAVRAMDLPAWLVMGPLGFGLIVAFRRRHKRRMFMGQRSPALH